MRRRTAKWNDITIAWKLRLIQVEIRKTSLDVAVTLDLLQLRSGSDGPAQNGNLQVRYKYWNCLGTYTLILAQSSCTEQVRGSRRPGDFWANKLPYPLTESCDHACITGSLTIYRSTALKSGFCTNVWNYCSEPQLGFFTCVSLRWEFFASIAFRFKLYEIDDK